MNKEELSILETIRDMFPGNAYVGGSFALNAGLSQAIPYNDLDIFIYCRKPMTTENLDYLIASKFDILCRGYNYTGAYKIEGQYKLYKVAKGSITMDLIFIDPDRITKWENTIGSGLAAAQFRLGYGPSIIEKTAFPSETLKILFYYVKSESCIPVYSKYNTPSQLEKVRDRASVLGLRIDYIS